jgi:hypothetical protein
MADDPKGDTPPAPPAGETPPPADNPPTDAPPADEPPKPKLTLLVDAPPATDDQPPADNPPPADDKPPAAAVPDKYDLKLPEDSVFDEALFEKAAPVYKELGLSQEQAQKVTDFISAEATALTQLYLDAQQPGGAAWEERVTAWESEAKKHPELGGGDEAKFKVNVELAKRVLVTYFPKEVHDVLYKTGYASHPAFLRALVKIGQASSEDSLIVPRGDPVPEKKSTAELLYGSSTT